MAHEMGEGQFWVWATGRPARITRLTNAGRIPVAGQIFPCFALGPRGGDGGIHWIIPSPWEVPGYHAFGMFPGRRSLGHNACCAEPFPKPSFPSFGASGPTMCVSTTKFIHHSSQRLSRRENMSLAESLIDGEARERRPFRTATTSMAITTKSHAVRSIAWSQCEFQRDSWYLERRIRHCVRDSGDDRCHPVRSDVNSNRLAARGTVV